MNLDFFQLLALKFIKERRESSGEAYVEFEFNDLKLMAKTMSGEWKDITHKVDNLLKEFARLKSENSNEELITKKYMDAYDERRDSLTLKDFEKFTCPISASSSDKLKFENSSGELTIAPDGVSRMIFRANIIKELGIFIQDKMNFLWSSSSIKVDEKIYILTEQELSKVLRVRSNTLSTERQYQNELNESLSRFSKDSVSNDIMQYYDNDSQLEEENSVGRVDDNNIGTHLDPHLRLESGISKLLNKLKEENNEE